MSIMVVGGINSICSNFAIVRFAMRSKRVIKFGSSLLAIISPICIRFGTLFNAEVSKFVVISTRKLLHSQCRTDVVFIPYIATMKKTSIALSLFVLFFFCRVL